MEEERITGNLEWDGLHRPQLFYAMGAVWCGIFLSVVDGNICNVALPVIAQELGVSPADSIWVVNAFQLVVMMALLPFSTLGELYSYKKVYLSGVAVFTVASVVWPCLRWHPFSVRFPTVCLCSWHPGHSRDWGRR